MKVRECTNLGLKCTRLLIAVVCFTASASLSSFASCGSPANKIEQENCQPGTPQSVWDVTGAGDPTIQGFATDISYNIGSTVQFKISTPATGYTISIYRMGYYQG